jgi:hypothetical protein
MTTDKINLSYYELAPSLQNMLDNLSSKDAFNIINEKAIDINSRVNDITVTVGPNRPTTVTEKKNLNLNSQTNILESYHNGIWNGNAIRFK